MSYQSDVRSCEVYVLVVSVFLVSITCIIGYVGNIISLILFTKVRPKSDTILLLEALAIVDFLFLVPIPVLFVVPGVATFIKTDMYHFGYVEKYGWAVASMMHTSTVWITTLVTIHRFASVCKPHKNWSHRLRTMQATKIQLAVVLIASVLFNVPRFFEYDVEPKVKVVNNNTVKTYVRTTSQIGQNLVFQILYKNVLFYLLMFVIPLTTLIVLTFKLVRALQTFKKVQKSLNVQEKFEEGVTLALVVVVIVFIICQTCTPVARVLYALFQDQGRECGHFFFYFEPISDYLAVLNSAINFIIYVICAPKFRKDFINMVRACKPGRRVHPET